MKEFWDKVQVKSSQECWNWKFSRSSGRPTFKFQGKWQNCSRVAWKITHGQIPPGLLICHTCDNPRCVNPGHLFLGTPKDNVEDVRRKHREARRLNPSEVKAIQESVLPPRILAENFGVSKGTIIVIRTRFPYG